MKTETHTEEIRCPECGLVQFATVDHTFPWWTYIHDCLGCGYTIMESDWIVLEKTFNKNK
jgi:ribosomal protein S27E